MDTLNVFQIIESIPHALATVDTISPDRVPVLISQDNSSRCKGDGAKNGVARKIGSEKVFILFCSSYFL